MIRYVTGDILSGLDDSRRTFICQQVNCQGVMGAGLAKQIRTKWPIVFTEYKQFCDKRSPRWLFADYQLVKVGEKTYVVNIFGQLNYGTDKRYTSYYALSAAFYNMFSSYCNMFDSYCASKKQKEGVTFRIPYGLGCGLGGGDWPTVLSIIADAASQYDVDVEIWRRS